MGRVGASTPLRLKAHSERSFSGSKSDLPIRGVECTADVAPGWLRPCATAVSRRIGDTCQCNDYGGTGAKFGGCQSLTVCCNAPRKTDVTIQTIATISITYLAPRRAFKSPRSANRSL